ncbi:hypothetical protein F4553_007400 [Allocatelliglobosispora scoriae]|uniref:Uncharacterized protein n=1 Tax=Allocatelliglobosispora scoriae TaxID=643052 RepID=A0A841C252_9ACTN|nr:hypothetical protein [Allocatelliglobosispora scoriae]MBB5873966.1 hypothetical protein [Allocatelliglobosispora scoriae]
MTVPGRPTPPAVRLLTALLIATSIATAAVEALNWWVTPGGGWALFVRTGWALLRSLGFLILIYHVRKGRRSAAPLGLILAVTTIFGVARLVVPRTGYPALPGIAGFALVTVLCLTVVVLLYRSATLQEHLVRPPNRITVTKQGIEWLPAKSTRPPIPGWLLTARVASFTYAPLMIVASVIALGNVFSGEVGALPLVIVWFIAALTMSNLMVLIAIFLLRGHRWARWALGLLTVAVLALHLALCWLLLDLDGLVRDGGPLAAAALLCLWGLWRAPAKPLQPA